MNSLLLAIILIPVVEIYLFIKIGSSIGAFNTILLIFFTAFIGIYYARAEGLNTLNQGLKKMVKDEMPVYELISGALIGIGAILFGAMSIMLRNESGGFAFWNGPTMAVIYGVGMIVLGLCIIFGISL